jgi:hypothetical protein
VKSINVLEVLALYNCKLKLERLILFVAKQIRAGAIVPRDPLAPTIETNTMGGLLNPLLGKLMVTPPVVLGAILNGCDGRVVMEELYIGRLLF